MTKPTTVPDVEISDDAGPIDPAEVRDGSVPGESTQEITSLDEQIWVR